LRSTNLAGLGFAEAGAAWLESRKPYLSAKTIHEYGLNLKTLGIFFGEMKLAEITPDQIRIFQRMRLQSCGPFTINHECSVLQQMLKRIGRWPEIAPDFQALPLPKEKRGRALSDQQKARLIQLAADNPNWQAAYLFTLISINTSAGPKETATLRLKDIHLEERTIYVQPGGAKNVHRVRRIPLNDEAFKGVQMALLRAQDLGAVEPEHYLFPFRLKRNKFDPARHQTTFKTAWRKLIAAAQIPGFRAYDLRHHAITTLLENPKVSEETAESIAGHISREMKKAYSHIRLEAQRDAVEALIAPKKKVEKHPPPTEKKEDMRDLAREFLKAMTDLLKTG
jgi:integrase